MPRGPRDVVAVVCPSLPQRPNDDRSGHNADDSGPLNHAPYSAKTHLSCLVSTLARSWQCGVMATVLSNLLNLSEEGVVCSHALRGGDWVWLA